MTEKIIAELSDRERIRELISRMNWLSDDNNLDELLGQFTDQLRYEVEGMAVFHDKAALRNFYEQVVGSFGMRIHRTSNEIIELDGERAHAQNYWRADLEFKGKAIVSAGRYFDDFVRVDGEWRCSSRRATLTYISPLDEGWAQTRFFSLA